MELLLKILFALPVYQSVILSIFLFSSSSRKLSYSRLLMGLFQLLMAFYFTFNFLYSIRAFEIVAALYFFILPVILMFIPVFYLYILSITSPIFRFKRSHIIHFLPAILITLLNTPYLFAPHAERLDFISHGFSMSGNNNLSGFLLVIYMIGILGIFTVQLAFYTIKAFRLYREHKTYIENRYSYTKNINLDWILASIVCFVVFFVFNDILYLVGFRQQNLTQILYNLAMLSTTLFVGYRGLIQIDLNSGEQNIGLKVLIQKDFRDNALMPNPIDAGKSEFSLDSEVQEDIEASKHAISKKYSGSTLTGSQKKLLISKLEHLMQHEKLFINEKLSIEDVAIKLDTNSKYVSQIINETFNKNFYHFINSYRIDEAKRLLTSKGNEKYSILGIAQSVGFVSKSTFNVAFKRFTGLTPTEYIIQAETQSAGSTE